MINLHESTGPDRDRLFSFFCFQVEESYKLETAFRGTFGSEAKPNICVISEFDALPEIGHACGHNLIAEVGVASAVGIMAAMKASSKPLGKVISES